MQRKKYRDLILGNVVLLGETPREGREPFLQLSEQIYAGKSVLRVNTVDFIVAKILDSKGRIYKFSQKRRYFNVYVIGTFRKVFRPTYYVAEALADFYLEMNVLPSIIAIPKHVFMKDTRRYANRIRGGVLLYERGRGLLERGTTFSHEL